MDTDKDFQIAHNRYHAEFTHFSPAFKNHVITTFSWKWYLAKKSHSMSTALVIIQWFILLAQGSQYALWGKKKSFPFNSTLIHYLTDLLLLDMQLFAFIMPLRHSNKTVITE